MKKTLYIIPQIYVVKLHQQALMQYASPASPPKLRMGTGTEYESDTNWQIDPEDLNSDYNL